LQVIRVERTIHGEGVVGFQVSDGWLGGMACPLGGIEKQPFGAVCPAQVAGFLEQVCVGVEQFVDGAVFITSFAGICCATCNEFVADRGARRSKTSF
jgi:hypothetical protein